ncbi:MAG TPA: M24 family metallopeptidase [Solirubrobacterales bacterium]|nr:M24 family metallopeptidase [Solirubrobacterales bacterium]
MTDTDSINGIPRSEFAERRAELRRRLAERGLDGVLVVSRGANGADWGADVVYLTNHYSPFPQIPDRAPMWSGRGSASVVMPADEDASLVVEIPDWRRDLVVCDDVRFAADLWGGTAETLKDRGLGSGRIGLIGRESLPYIAIDRIKAELPGLEFEWADDLIESMRLIKSPAELDLVRESVRVGSDMVAAFLEAAVPGATEADCVIAAFSKGVSQGAFPLDIPVTSGEHIDHFQWDRMPSWNHTRRLETGDMIHPDMYGTVGGYFYDMVRTTVVGRKVTDAQREVLEAPISLVETVVDAMKPGVSCGELFEIGAAWLAEHDFEVPGGEAEGNFAQSFPSFGHSMGLAWEHPFVVPNEPTVLEPGMVFAIEVEIGRPGAGTGAFEHDVIVTEDGVENMTDSLRRVWWE